MKNPYHYWRSCIEEARPALAELQMLERVIDRIRGEDGFYERCMDSVRYLKAVEPRHYLSSRSILFILREAESSPRAASDPEYLTVRAESELFLGLCSEAIDTIEKAREIGAGEGDDGAFLDFLESCALMSVRRLDKALEIAEKRAAEDEDTVFSMIRESIKHNEADPSSIINSVYLMRYAEERGSISEHKKLAENAEDFASSVRYGWGISRGSTDVDKLVDLRLIKPIEERSDLFLKTSLQTKFGWVPLVFRMNKNVLTHLSLENIKYRLKLVNERLEGLEYESMIELRYDVEGTISGVFRDGSSVEYVSASEGEGLSYSDDPLEVGSGRRAAEKDSSVGLEAVSRLSSKLGRSRDEALLLAKSLLEVSGGPAWALEKALRTLIDHLRPDDAQVRLVFSDALARLGHWAEVEGIVMGENALYDDAAYQLLCASSRRLENFKTEKSFADIADGIAGRLAAFRSELEEEFDSRTSFCRVQRLLVAAFGIRFLNEFPVHLERSESGFTLHLSCRGRRAAAFLMLVLKKKLAERIPEWRFSVGLPAGVVPTVGADAGSEIVGSISSIPVWLEWGADGFKASVLFPTFAAADHDEITNMLTQFVVEKVAASFSEAVNMAYNVRVRLIASPVKDKTPTSFANLQAEAEKLNPSVSSLTVEAIMSSPEVYSVSGPEQSRYAFQSDFVRGESLVKSLSVDPGPQAVSDATKLLRWGADSGWFFIKATGSQGEDKARLERLKEAVRSLAQEDGRFSYIGWIEGKERMYVECIGFDCPLRRHASKLTRATGIKVGFERMF